MSAGQATGAAKALCDVMGWDANLGRSDGIPNGGQLAVEVVEELREAGWAIVPTPALGVHPFTEDTEAYCVECGNHREHAMHRRNFTIVPVHVGGSQEPDGE